ncbi:hypothetical protein AALP_AA6G182800 [Arabis alpina]|uniref:Uncharacterized protein n=1 Tax=Arabis alpina TaxID=50452 RepID=A0A087GQ14_ARAAL|nr:hypothetical protein AALP_AA6G182800 [Arabis alpina]
MAGSSSTAAAHSLSSSDGQSPLRPSKQHGFVKIKSFLVAGTSSGVESSVNVDPRWPLLNRWSAKTVLSSGPVEELRLVASTVEVQAVTSPPVVDLTPSALTKTQSMSSASGHDAHNSLEKETLPPAKGAWEKPLSILSPPLHQAATVIQLSEPSKSHDLSNVNSGTKTRGNEIWFRIQNE